MALPCSTTTTTTTQQQAFAATMAPQLVGLGPNDIVNHHPVQGPAAAASPQEIEGAYTYAAAADVDERRLRRRISNRESARRSRARKQRRLHELRDRVARLEGGRRELAARVEAARGRLAMARLANTGMRAEAAALTRRLAAAARRALVLRHLYAAATAGGCGVGLDIEQTIASLIA